MVNRVTNAILAPFAARNDPPQVAAGQAASCSELLATHNTHMLQVGSEVLARENQEFQSERRISALEQDGIQVKDYLDKLQAELERERFQARAASAAYRLELDGYKTDMNKLQASFKQAQDVIADKDTRLRNSVPKLCRLSPRLTRESKSTRLILSD